MTRMQSSASGCFDLLYKHFNYIKNMGRQWPSMTTLYILNDKNIDKINNIQKTKGSDYLTTLTLGQYMYIIYYNIL